MVTLDYEYYSSSYGGSLDEKAFAFNLPICYKLIRSYTNSLFLKVSDDDENLELLNDVRMCLCNLLDRVVSNRENGDRVVSSQTVGKVSVSYATNTSNSTIEKDYSRIVKLWLSEYGFTSCQWI